MRALAILLFAATAARAADLTVTVQDPQRQPIPGVMVTLGGRPPVVTNDTGRLVFRGLERRAYAVSARLEGALSVPATVCMTGGDREIALILNFDGGSCCVIWPDAPPPEMRWKGTVVDLEGAPLGNAFVEGDWRGGSRTVVTDAAGEFAFDVPTAETGVRFRLSKAGYETRELVASCWPQLVLQLAESCGGSAAPVE